MIILLKVKRCRESSSVLPSELSNAGTVLTEAPLSSINGELLLRLEFEDMNKIGWVNLELVEMMTLGRVLCSGALYVVVTLCSLPIPL